MKTFSLGDIVTFHSGGTPPKANQGYWTGRVPWFSAKDVKTPVLNDSIDHISEDVFRSTPLRKFPRGTIVMVVRGMILAHTVPIGILDVDAAINQDLKALVPRGDLVPSYLVAMLNAQHAEILSQVGTAAHGTKKLESRVLESLKVPLPSMADQRRIANVLDRARALCVKRHDALGLIDDLTQSVFQKMFGDQRFEEVPAVALMPRMRNGLSPASDGKHSARVLTLSAVTRGVFDPAAAKEGMFALDPPPEKRVSRDDFLMCRGNGNKALVGVGVHSPVDRSDLVFPDTVIAGRVDQSRVALPFLEVAWKQESVRDQIESAARTTNGTYKVNQQSLSRVMLPLPPLSLQREFAVKSARIASLRSILVGALDQALELADSLQKQAFAGLI